ncbi:MAG: ATP-binding protein [Candidatus Pacearchaeota archaeon]|nr:ATP-binding protein [Candidatus Pacearchaeota archaeon]
MDKSAIKEIVFDQNKAKQSKDLIKREVFVKAESSIKNPFVIVLSGVRRCGKSTLLGQIREKYPGYYLNFDDERLVNFKLEDFQGLYEIFLELYGENGIFYFDEIQNISGWERFVRRLRDEEKKVFVSGSNASMLSRELGTHLTGRHLSITLFPFSFREFLVFNNFNLDKDSTHVTETKAKIKRYFEDYLLNGGMPEYVKTKNKDYLKILYENIIYRDILVRYGINNEKAFKELVSLAINSLSKEISFNSIKKLLKLGSSTTVKEYFDKLENSYLVFLLPRFDFSLKKQINSNKKVYVIDNAIASYLGFKFSKDLGKLLENLVFIELKRKEKELYYFSEKKECDFVVREGAKIIEAIQVCYDFNDENREREVAGLLEALEKFKLKEGIILTYDQEEEIKEKGKRIIVKPVWKWLLEK